MRKNRNDSCVVTNLVLHFIPQGCWYVTWYAPNVYYMYVARFLGGCFIGGGAYGILVPVFLNDIASDQ